VVLEPIAPPRVGQTLNLLALLLVGGISLTSATLVSVSGDVPIVLVGASLSLGFLSRFIGITMAKSRDLWTMGWTPRVLSWIAFGAATTMVALIGAARLMFVLGAFVAIDAATAFVKREVRKGLPRRKGMLWSRVKFPLFASLYLGGVAAFHFLVGIYLPYGVLVTWSLLALGFCIILRSMLVAQKADESWLLAPRDHRLHERREEVVADPQRERAEQVLQALKARGDAAGFLEFVRTAATDAGLRPADLAALEERILASLARAGTTREADVETALAEVERFLSPRGSKEIRPS